jgi:teichuronic acid biosynthesis glycosyltransferase TuaC
MSSKIDDNTAIQTESTLLHSASRPSPIHVLTLTPFFPFAGNPIYGSYVSEPIQHFAGCGLESTVIGVSPVYHSRRNALAGTRTAWLRYFQLPGNFGLTTAGLSLYMRLAPFVERLHRRNPITVIHAHAALPCGHAASLLSARLHVPFVVTVHGLDAFNTCFGSGSFAVKRRAEISAKVYEQAGSVICVSGAIQGIIEKGVRGPVRCRVIYNGTDPEMFFPANDAAQGPPSILIVGNLLSTKGHDVVLRAMARVVNSFPQLTCQVIGEGPEREHTVALARDLRLSDRVIFTGRRSREEVAEAMRKCTVFALPSRSEGLGCVYLEAMACGKAAIACEGQGIAEIIRHGHNGWLIPVDGIDEMADAMLRLFSSAELRSQIGACARQTILNGLTLNHQVHRLATVYREAAIA